MSDEPIQIEKRSNVISATANARLYAMLAVGLCVAVIAFSLLAPRERELSDRTMDLITYAMIALIGASVRGLSVGVDGQMSRIMGMIAEKEYAKGKVDAINEVSNGKIPLIPE